MCWWKKKCYTGWNYIKQVCQAKHLCWATVEIGSWWGWTWMFAAEERERSKPFRNRSRCRVKKVRFRPVGKWNFVSFSHPRKIFLAALGKSTISPLEKISPTNMLRAPLAVIAWLESMTRLESRFLVTRNRLESRWEKSWLDSTRVTFFTKWLYSNRVVVNESRLESKSFLQNLWVPDGQTQFVCPQKMSIFCFSDGQDRRKFSILSL